MAVRLFLLPLLICALSAAPWLGGFALAAAKPTPTAELGKQVDAVSAMYEKTKKEAQKLKNAWDKARLETTLYDQRSKRAYTKWVKSAKSVRKEAQAARERAELELSLAVEKRKLAYFNWQEAFFRMQAEEMKLKALEQAKDGHAALQKIKEIEQKLSPPSLTPDTK